MHHAQVLLGSRDKAILEEEAGWIPVRR